MVNKEEVKAFNTKPLKLSANNFTPLSRTPWAGEQISRNIKDLVAPDRVGDKIGESWEFSCDPDFPSKVVSTGVTLKDWVELDPARVLSTTAVTAGATGIDLLVKILGPADRLSVQVHPGDDDPALKPNECGKPESWLVLDAEPGAGIYLGFSRPVTTQDLRDVIQNEPHTLEEYLNFIEVKPGDYFEILPGVPHAIGGGTTILEPQRVLPGKSGKTFRFWDWGRKYNKQGLPDEDGEARELHLEEALNLIRPEELSGDLFLQNVQRHGFELEVNGIKSYSFPANEFYQTHYFETDGPVRAKIEIIGGYGALVVLGGQLMINGVTFRKGESGLLPATCMPCEARIEPDSTYAIIHPAGAKYCLS
jgi:mannose-6-phosphate isomerase